MEKRTEQELEGIIGSRNLNLHPKSKSFLGKSNYSKMMRILNSDFITDMDYLILDDGIPYAEIDQFFYLSEEFRALHQEIYNLGDQIIQHISEGLPLKLRDTKNKKNQYNNNKGLVKMQKTTFDVLESLFDTPLACRNSFGSLLFNYVGQNMFMDIWFDVFSSDFLKKYKNLLADIIEIWDKSFIHNLGVSFPGKVGLGSIKGFRMTYVKHGEKLKRILKAYKDGETYPFERKLKDIQNLSSLRTIQNYSQSYRGANVHLYGSGENDNTRISHICRVKISFEKSDFMIKNIRRGRNNNTITSLEIDDNAFHLTICRSTGEIFLGNSMISLDRQVEKFRGNPFITKEEFYSLKAFIYDFVLSYLSSKEEDITRIQPDVNLYSKPIREDITKVLDDEPETIQEEEINYVYHPYQEPSEVNIDLIPEGIVIEDIELRGSFKEFMVIRAIQRITKIPANTRAGKGSHVMLTGVNGVKFPMPSHKGKDIALPILKNCLKKLGIPYSVFKEEY